jgi:hypothetical protein
MSLHQYFDYIKNNTSKGACNNRRCIIPHYVGARSSPAYPPTEGYAKSVLLLHVPWQDKFDHQAQGRNYIEEFKAFIKNQIVQLESKLAMSVQKQDMNRKNNLLNQQEKEKTSVMNHFLQLLMTVLMKLLHWQVHLDIHWVWMYLKKMSFFMEMNQQTGVHNITRYDPKSFFLFFDS